MAAPHAAGVAALLRAAGVEDPDAVERMLKQSAEDLGDARKYGSGLIHADHALRLASQGGGTARAGLALALSALVLLGLRRRRRLGVGALATGAFALVFAGGLGLLPWHWLGSTGAAVAAPLSLGVLGQGASLVGPLAAGLVLSVLPAFVAVALGQHVPRLRSALVGLSLGSAAFLVVEALWPTLRVGLLPELLVGPWLLLNALLAVGLAWLVAARAR
jgi:serine protease